ncbi:MAG: hypothetical protein QXR74_07390 [Candidatus Bathyarchaeia archaeon]
MKTSYEYLVRVELLKEAMKAEDVMKYLNGKGFNPVAVSVDNTLGRIMAYFGSPLSDEEKKRLDEAMSKYVKSLKG